MEVIIFDKDLGTITYDGNLIHDDSTIIKDTSTITLTPIGNDNCNLTLFTCNAYIITLDLDISADFNGSELIPKNYRTNIII